MREVFAMMLDEFSAPYSRDLAGL